MKGISSKEEHILVCLSSSPSNPKVIRTASKMAQVFDASFTALYIETSKPITAENKKRLDNNTRLAKECGAKIVTVNGDDIAAQVSEYAKAGRVTKIIIGRSGYRPNRLFTPPNFIDKLIGLTPDIEIYVIPDKAQRLYIGQRQTKLSFKDILQSLAVLTIAALIGLIFYKLNINEANIIMIYILGLMLISYVTRIKRQARQSSQKAYRTEIMLEMSQKLQQCSSKEEITKVTCEQINKLLNCDLNLYTEKQENDIVNDVFENNKQIVKDSQGIYLPVSSLDKVFAVVEILNTNISEFEQSLLIAMLRESALAYEKDAISQVKNELIIKNKQEELRSTLLRAISHDLRTPLTSISGYAEILMKNASILSDDKKQDIFTNIYDDSIWLLNLVENLLSITRFDKNEITIKQESEFIIDVITEALSHLGRKKEDYNVQTVIEDESISAKMDGKLIAQVIFNLVDNAMKYAPPHTTITVRAKAVGEFIEISVEDEGNGIKDEDKKKIFDMFYTVNNSIADGRRGLGLGLALCKAVVNAHGGKIEIKDNKPKGTIFSFRLTGDFYE
ncbi:putative uncharacterized protein [Fusobacterium sp. CAG:439]|nr:putative uncharacterized protein [Fusobacterium sp. CAG:439]